MSRVLDLIVFWSRPAMVLVALDILAGCMSDPSSVSGASRQVSDLTGGTAVDMTEYPEVVYILPNIKATIRRIQEIYFQERSDIFLRALGFHFRVVRPLGVGQY